MVGVTGIEPAPSWSQTKRLTIRQHPENIQFFLNYGQTCGQAAFFPAARSRFARVFAVFRPIARFSENRSRKRLHAPKMSRAPNCATPRFYIEFLRFCVEVGQTVVKPEFYAILRFCEVPKMPVLQGFFALLIFEDG